MRSLGRCPSCDSALVEGARFCAHCGTQVADMRDAAERRLLTVAFFDLVGSTSISERLDPEEYRDLVLAYQDVSVGAIEDARGYVADYRGDAVLAYFGYPVAREDDAVRCVRSALDAVRRVRESGTDLQLRIGIHTGIVVVGDAGGGSRRKHDVVMGDAPNIAARVQAFAEPGRVVITEDTLRLLGGRFDVSDLGTPALKGITRPIRLCAVVDEARARVSPPSGDTPFVGRGAELRVLDDAFRKAADRHGRSVVVTGEPGVGKSRLLRAFADHLDGTQHAWIELHASEADSMSPLRPVIELLQASATDAISDDQLLRGLTGPDPDLAPHLQRRRTMNALVDWLLRDAADAPLVISVEDAQWLDPTTSDLLGSLDAAIARRPVLLLVASRQRETGWTAVAPRTTLQLEPLNGEAAAELARTIAGADLDDEVLADVVARTDGVPLFVEQITRAVLDAGTANIPTSLHQSLAARLDRLGAARELAQVAAVVARDFDANLLATVMERSPSTIAADLRALVRSGLVEPMPQSSRDAHIFRFRHALVRDVAYESLLRSRRRVLHARIANAFAELDPVLVRSQPEVIAHHYSEAGETRAAIDFWTRAAQTASERHGLTEAVEHATHAIEAVRTLGGYDDRDQWELALILLLMRLIVQSAGPADQRMEQIFRRAEELTASKGEDSIDRFSARSGLCAFFIGHARFPEALEVAREMADTADRTARRTFRLFSSEWLGIVQYYRGEFWKALGHLRDAHSVYRPDRDLAAAQLYGFDMGTSALFHTAYVLWFLGKPDESLDVMAEARAHAATLPFDFPLCHAVVASALLHAQRDEIDLATEHADRAIAMAASNEWTVMARQAAFAKGRAAWLRGDPESATTIIEPAVGELLQPGGFGGSTLALTWLAEAELDAGRNDRARSTIARTEAIVRRTDERLFVPELMRVKSRALIAIGRSEDAAAEADGALALARAHGNAAFEAKARVTRGRGAS